MKYRQELLWRLLLEIVIQYLASGVLVVGGETSVWKLAGAVTPD